jgi:UDP-N-acetylglucosamine 2-epimerase (non-hydrolysing)
MAGFRVLVVFGTRAEAIKLCVLIRRLQSSPNHFDVRTCVTAQHRSMLDQVLRTFEVTPDYDLNLMREGQTLGGSTAAVLAALDPVLAEELPDLVLVQGDTTTAFAAALAAFYARIPVGHVEAGLRSGDTSSPFPEEINRQFIGRLATLHFAATPGAFLNLCQEGVAASAITVTGNTVVDAVHYVRGALAQGLLPQKTWPFLDPRRKLIVATAHRRESFGPGLARMCEALATLSRRDDVQVVFPVHRNPAVWWEVRRLLGCCPRIHLCEPLEYSAFLSLLSRSHLVLTDSGGIQEEAPSLGKPLLVMRRNTERPEGLEAGVAKLVGTDPAVIVAEAARLLDDPVLHGRMTQARNPYGDGKACQRIVNALARHAAARGVTAEKPKAFAAAQALG